MNDIEASSAELLEQIRDIACEFDIPGHPEAHDFAGKGNINQQTYLIDAGLRNGHTQYLLQLLNPAVFTKPRFVMEAMISCIRAQNKALSEGTLRGEDWEAIQLIPTKRGDDYLEKAGKSGNECWRMMVRIGNSQTYRSLREIPDHDTRISIAEQAGRGLAIFGTLTSRMDPAKVGSSLPGYRDTELYYNQLLSVLAGSATLEDAAQYLPSDPVVRESTARHFVVGLDRTEFQNRLHDPALKRFIALAIDSKSFGLTISQKLKTGDLKKVVIHGDTKLDNFLFDSRTGKVKALVDLDTIMPHTWLSDWGDMVRSLVNVAGEKEENLSKIQVDEEVLSALARGFLHSARHAAPQEIDMMANSPQIMALELGIRFLADYLRGDTYFKLGHGEPRDLNKTRAMVQLSLFERFQANRDSTHRIIRSFQK